MFFKSAYQHTFLKRILNYFIFHGILIYSIIRGIIPVFGNWNAQLSIYYFLIAS